MRKGEEEKPPFGKSWKQWYWAVLLVLLIQIGVYYFITQKYKWVP
ncbi:MAG: hypothetical protein RML72_03915 [Bacteroidia bacterium]|nr:hypothetical protein [Bacteroidia bacterium]